MYESINVDMRISAHTYIYQGPERIGLEEGYCPTIYTPNCVRGHQTFILKSHFVVNADSTTVRKLCTPRIIIVCPSDYLSIVTNHYDCVITAERKKKNCDIFF